MASQKQPSDIDRQVGETLRTIRKRVGLSQAELGEAIGISFQQLQKYETGANRITAGRLFEFASALGCEVQDFFPAKIDLDDSDLSHPGICKVRQIKLELINKISRIKNEAQLRMMMQLLPIVATVGTDKE